MKKIILIGPNSYLAQNLFWKLSLQYDVFVLRYNEWQSNLVLLLNSDYIINFAIQPECNTMFLKDDIIDLKIVKHIKDRDIKYIFLSSRKVYGYSSECKIYRENDELKGHDWYAKNKIYTESKILDMLHDKAVILRIPNVIAEPLLNPQNNIFMSWLVNQYLYKSKVEINIDKNTIKDFITRDFFHKIILYIIDNHISGIYNVSSNIAIPIYDIIAKMIEEQYIECMPTIYQSDQFLLDNSKLYNATRLKLDIDTIYEQLEKNRILIQNLKKEVQENE